MSVRHAVRRVGASFAATAAAGAFVALAFALPTAAPAGASTACAVSGDQCLGAAQPVAGAFTAGQPFDSGQSITVSVPANQVFAGTDATVNKNVVECSAPNGVIPTLSTACDGLTIQGPTLLPNANGSFTLTGYTVYALPDSISLGEGTGGPVCGNTLATECILYMGDNYNDFTKPHLWSQPFLITANGNDLGANPGDGTPEFPMAVLAPVAALGVLGGAVLIRRRRKPAKVS